MKYCICVFLRLIYVAALATVVMDVLAQTERMVGKNTFSQPLMLIECIRCVLKGLEMFSSE